MTPRLIESQVFVPDTCELGEGPFWFEGRLWWVDINAGKLHSVDGQGQDRTTLSVGRKLGAVAPVDADHFIAALEDGIGLVHRSSAAVEILASPEGPELGNRFNDGKCDPAGRFIAGTLSMEGRKKAASLYSFESSGAWQALLTEVTLSNGLAWTSDGTTLYHIDTLACLISSYPYDLATGRIGAGKVVVEVPRELGFPDGMEIDAEGNLWVAHWGGSAVRCWSPATGECLAEIRTPCPQPSSCCFGGPELNQLLITSAREGMSEEALREYPLSGSVFVCDPGVSGRPVQPFRKK